MTTKLKKRPSGSLLAPVLSALLASGVSAFGATITYFGNVEGAQVTDWRTTTTSKTLDLDGDNFYGTHGAVHWNVAGANEQPAGSTTPGWAYHGAGAGFAINPTFASIDHINSYPTNTNAGIIHGGPATFTFELTGSAATYIGQTVRVGIMQDVLGPDEWASDTNKGLQIAQTVGGSGDSGVILLRSGGAGNGSPEMYFFDLTGVTAGDRFQITGHLGVGGPVTQAGYIGPVSWDVIPEPSAALLGSFGILGLLRRRR